MQTASERKKMNQYLAQRGLGQLNDPGVVSQLGYLVRDHTHFRQLLFAAEPHLRKEMYDAMSPYLRFPAKTLDQYEADARANADKKKLPAMDEEGKLIAYEDYVPGGKTNPLERLAEKAIHDAFVEEAAGGHVLVVECSKCTATAEFKGATVVSATIEARRAGWVYQEIDGKAVEICPKCPSARPVKMGHA
jgi:hypothetical protein